jgi:hypothetical protein
MTTPKQIDDGGGAFPPLLHGDYARGMSLRDYFAAAALQGYCANPDCGSMSVKTIAKAAYEISDLMLAARKGGA